MDRQLSAALVQLVPSLEQGQLQGALGPAVRASLSSDPALRQTLLQGLCLFTVAAAKAGSAGSAGSAVHDGTAAKTGKAGKASNHGTAGLAGVSERAPSDITLSEMESQASMVASAVKTSIGKALKKVGSTLFVAKVMQVFSVCPKQAAK